MACSRSWFWAISIMLFALATVCVVISACIWARSSRLLTVFCASSACSLPSSELVIRLRVFFRPSACSAALRDATLCFLASAVSAWALNEASAFATTCNAAAWKKCGAPATASAGMTAFWLATEKFPGMATPDRFNDPVASIMCCCTSTPTPSTPMPDNCAALADGCICCGVC